MNFYIMTLFPEMVMDGLNTSIIGRAVNKGLLSIEALNIRDYAFNKHHSVDDYPSRSGAKANIKIDGNRVPLLGDADGDYSITVVDATTIQKIAINLMSIAADDANAFKTCDANEDGRISIKDATIVQKYIVGGYETGNVGSPISVE